MKLGLELVARRPVTLQLGTFFENWLATSSGTVRRSLGRNEYHLSLTINAGRRLAATGRTNICQVDMEAAELGPNEARQAVLTDADAASGAPLIWGIRTNAFLNLRALTAGASGRLLRDTEPPLEFDLDHPLLGADEVAPGRYIIDISALLVR